MISGKENDRHEHKREHSPQNKPLTGILSLVFAALAVIVARLAVGERPGVLGRLGYSVVLVITVGINEEVIFRGLLFCGLMILISLPPTIKAVKGFKAMGTDEGPFSDAPADTEKETAE